MRVTEKGQVTIPKHIRDRLGIKPGSEIEIKIREEICVLEKKPARETQSEERKREVREWAESVSGSVDLEGMSVDEYMRFLRD